jgi:hypothetical protein
MIICKKLFLTSRFSFGLYKNLGSSRHGFYLPLHELGKSLIMVTDLKQPLSRPLFNSRKCFADTVLHLFPNIFIWIRIWAVSWQFSSLTFFIIIHHSFGSMTWRGVLHENVSLLETILPSFERGSFPRLVYIVLSTPSHLQHVMDNGPVPFQKSTEQTMIFFEIFDTLFHTVNEQFFPRPALYRLMPVIHYLRCCFITAHL